jgi:hypothetical protein
VTPGDVICGREGTVKIGATDLPEITKFSFKTEVSTQEYASNKTDGYKRKVCGTKSASGSIEGKWDRNDMITSHFVEGDAVTLLLHLDATKKVSVPSIIKNLNIEVDIDSGNIESWTADYESDGAWTYSL